MDEDNETKPFDEVNETPDLEFTPEVDLNENPDELTPPELEDGVAPAPEEIHDDFADSETEEEIINYEPEEDESGPANEEIIEESASENEMPVDEIIEDAPAESEPEPVEKNEPIDEAPKPSDEPENHDGEGEPDQEPAEPTVIVDSDEPELDEKPEESPKEQPESEKPQDDDKPVDETVKESEAEPKTPLPVEKSSQPKAKTAGSDMSNLTPEQINAILAASMEGQKNQKKGISLKFWLALILVTIAIVAGVFALHASQEMLDKIKPNIRGGSSSQEPTTPEPPKDPVGKATEITANEVNLGDYDTDIVISSVGDYTLSGNFSHTIFVNSKSNEIHLIFNNVNVKSNAAIINLKNTVLNIEAKRGTKNSLESTELYTDYPATIYSTGSVSFTGEGYIEVIAPSNTDNGSVAIHSNNNAIFSANLAFVEGELDVKDYYLNGGNLIAIAKKSLPTPSVDSTHQSISKNETNGFINGNIISIYRRDTSDMIMRGVADRDYSFIVASSPVFNNADDYEIKITSDKNLSRGLIYPILDAGAVDE